MKRNNIDSENTKTDHLKTLLVVGAFKAVLVGSYIGYLITH